MKEILNQIKVIVLETLTSKKFWINIVTILMLFIIGMTAGRVYYEIKSGNELSIGKLILYAFMRMGVE